MTLSGDGGGPSCARAEVQAASLLRVLGRGGTGTVWLVADAQHPGEQRALKVVSQAAEARNAIAATGGGGAAYAEEAMLAAARHPFIVRFFGSTNDGVKSFILTEACVGGDLSSLIQARRAASAALGEDVARSLAACVVSALGYLHAQGLMFRDLKPENLIRDERGCVKLVDFGLAKRTDELSYTLCGTAEYVAPEVITMQGHGAAVDWWALGVITYELLHGHTPFSAEGTLDRPVDIYRRITHPDFKVSYADHLSKPALSFLKRLLRRKCASRLGASGAAEVRGHGWLSHIGWAALERGEIAAASVQLALDDAPPPLHERVVPSRCPARPASAQARWAELQSSRLFDAVRKRQLPEVLRLLAAGASPDAYVTRAGTTALMKAAELGLEAVAAALLAAGANANRRNEFGEAAIDLARMHAHKQLVAILPGGSHDFSRVNENKYPCRICLKVVGVGREGLFCSACYVCHGCGLSNTCEPQEARANIDCVNAFLKRQSSGSSHLGDRLKRPL